MSNDEMIQIAKTEGYKSINELISIECPNSFGYINYYEDKCVNFYSVPQGYCERCWRDAEREQV